MRPIRRRATSSAPVAGDRSGRAGITEAAGHRHLVDSLRFSLCSPWFFYLVGHGVPAEVLARVMAASRRFFAADEPSKDSVAAVRLGGLGYRRMGGRRLDGSAGSAVKEEYYCARDDVPGLDDVNRWPPLSDFRPAMTEYLEHCTSSPVGRRLCSPRRWAWTGTTSTSSAESHWPPCAWSAIQPMEPRQGRTPTSGHYVPAPGWPGWPAGLRSSDGRLDSCRADPGQLRRQSRRPVRGVH